MILSAIFGGGERRGPEAYGVPALFVSGVLNRSGGHYAKFRLALERGLEDLDLDSLPATHRTGTAVLLAELARTEPEEREDWLRRARALADGIEEPKFLAYARSAIAKASGEAEDLARAHEAALEATPPHRFESGELVFEVEDTYVLSRYLALTHAHADLAQLTRDPAERRLAEALLAFVFSERLFDGRVLVHDGARRGFRSPSYCSGCNLQALYLVDRLYGDTFKIDPLPALADRPSDWLARTVETHDLFAVHSGQIGTAILLDAGLIISVGYTEVAPSPEHPTGALRLDFEIKDSNQPCVFRRRGERAALVPLDDSDRVRYPVAADSVAEGDFDPERSQHTFEVGPREGQLRRIRLHSLRLRK